jgi:2-iminobutanoate/2-iminopropanoate deaminase
MGSIQMIQTQIGKGRPYSRAVRFGDLVFIHSQTGFDDATKQLVPGGIGPETTQAIKRIAALLETAGASLETILKMNVFIVDLKEVSELNKASMPFFTAHQPARTVIQVPFIEGGGRVEIEVIAAVAN